MQFVISKLDKLFGGRASRDTVAQEWFNNGNTGDLILMKCLRKSDRGACEEVYVASPGVTETLQEGVVVSYLIDTGRGFGGSGTLQFESFYLMTRHFKVMSKGEKLPVYLLKYIK